LTHVCQSRVNKHFCGFAIVPVTSWLLFQNSLTMY